MLTTRRTLLGFATTLIAALSIGWIAPTASADGYRSHRGYSSCSSGRYYRPPYRHHHYRPSYYSRRYHRPHSYSRYKSRWNHYNAGHYRYRGRYYLGSHRLSRLHR